jgi:hypothetical protein
MAARCAGAGGWRLDRTRCSVCLQAGSRGQLCSVLPPPGPGPAGNQHSSRSSCKSIHKALHGLTHLYIPIVIVHPQAASVGRRHGPRRAAYCICMDYILCIYIYMHHPWQAEQQRTLPLVVASTAAYPDLTRGTTLHYIIYVYCCWHNTLSIRCYTSSSSIIGGLVLIYLRIACSYYVVLLLF